MNDYRYDKPSRSLIAATERAAAFDKWWALSIHNGTLPKTTKSLAREAYYAAWGGGPLSIQKSTEGQS